MISARLIQLFPGKRPVPPTVDVIQAQRAKADVAFRQQPEVVINHYKGGSEHCRMLERVTDVILECRIERAHLVGRGTIGTDDFPVLRRLIRRPPPG